MFRRALLVAALAFPAGAAFADSTLIGGTPADPKEWPASVYASMSGASCSATVIGTKTLLIASHCVGNGKTASFAVGGNRYTSNCEHHPSYRGNSTADWTLCLVDKPVTGIPFESVNADPALVKVGDELQLTGYGCVRPGGGGGNDGVFRIGKAKVTRVAKPAIRDYDIVTKGGAALCYGDSGGAAYVCKDASCSQRVIAGVNSRGDIRTYSYLPAYATDAFRDWAVGWAKRKGEKPCGIDPAAVGCRGGATPQLPAECSALDGPLATWTKCLTAPQQPSEALCDDAHKALHACYDARSGAH
jgi:hypothetical protein